jgi:gluconolactonase
MYTLFLFTAALLLSCLYTNQKLKSNESVRISPQAVYAVEAATDTSGLIATGATLQQVSRDFRFTEGPAVDPQGNVFFTDQPNNRIWKYATDGTLSVFLEPSGRSNGLYFDHDGNIIACADEKNQLWRISPDKKITVLYKGRKGRKLNGPNDAWVDKKGGIYFTDPYYQRPYWKRTAPEIEGQHVYYLPRRKKKLIAVEENIKQPNGIVGTPDGKFLFVADIANSKIYKYEIALNGTLQNRKLFAEVLCDGMTLDNRGNLYTAGNGVSVFDSTGKKIEHIVVPEKWTANVCFGGAKRNQLFITASEGVYTIEMNVTGVE